MATTRDDMIGELQRANAELRRERDAALALRNSAYGERTAHQSATIDVLKAMSASPGDPQPAFDLIVRRARDLCDAYGATVYEFDGTLIHWRAATGVSDDPLVREAVEAIYPMAPSREWPVGCAIIDCQIIHIGDLETELGLSPAMRGITAKSSLVIPMMCGDAVIGALALGGRERGAFSDSQIELLKTFAEQAVIAIGSAETYRALQTRTADLQVSLEYQTATSDVLKVISRSTFDLQPVLDTLVETAARLCNADMAAIARPEGNLWRLAANFEFPPEFEADQRARGAYSIDPSSPTVLARAVSERRTVHIHDVAAVPGYPDALVGLAKQRTSLGVPMLREGEAIGVIVLARQRVEPFTDRQIELVSTFANQAVIAIENTRLLTEQREALDQQTATSDVLQVINSSLGDLTPVFDAILEKAHRLCGVTHGGLVLRDGETFRAVATHSYSGAFEEQLRQGYRGADNPITRSLIDGARFVHLPDMSQIDHPILRASFKLAGVRTGLYVPLCKDDVLLGMISCTRREIRPFSDKEIALVENFAAQAVIAMQNARLLGELRQRTGDLQESLEYQTAISDVLKVISRSTFDLQPVLETLLGTAARLCDADGGGISLREGDGYRMAANYKSSTEEYDAFFRNRLMTVDRGSVSGRAVLEARIIHVADVLADPEFTLPAVQLGVARTVLGVPLLRDGVVLGVMILTRRPVLPFTDRQIELVTTFADQAVIAIENVRLVTEQQEALEQQTATAEVLGVINASPGNLAPVFDAMLEKVLRLCESPFGTLGIYDGSAFHNVAMRGVTPELLEIICQPIRPTHGQALYQILCGGENVVHDVNIRANQAYLDGHPNRRAMADLGGVRTQLLVALRKEGVLRGFFCVFRQEVRPFTDKQIALVQNFAAQAVIAMENARLLGEIRAARDNAEATLRELKTAQANLIQAEKMASLGQLTAGIAHEIKNPLNFINNFSDLSVELLDELKATAAPGFAALDADRRAEIDEVVGTLTSNLEKITEHGRRADGIVRGMLEHSRGASGERRTVEINTLLDETLNLAYHGARAQDQSFNITLERDFAAGIPPVEVNPQDLTRVFLNIFSNGFYAAMKRARNGAETGFAPTLNVTTRDAGEAVEVRVRDNGTGIPPDIRDKLFQPFFTTKPTGEGTGLGLSISYDIVTQQHGGSIAVDSKVGEYSEFTIRLPRNPST